MTEYNECEKTNGKRKIWFAAAVIFAVIFVAVIVFVLLSFKGCTKDSADNEITTEETSVYYKGYSDLPKNPVDFDKWNKENIEIYAWLKIPGTSIDYPVLQSLKSDSYYLRRDIYGDYSVGGCLFTQSMNSTDFSDPNTVIYGHCMSNGTYFASLHNFRDPEFFENNRYFYIYLRGHILTYEIFAAYEYDDRHILLSYDFTDEAVVEEYFASCLNPQTLARNIRDGITLNAQSKIVTLSTCLKSGEDGKRYIVQGVLIEDESTQ